MTPPLPLTPPNSKPPGKRPCGNGSRASLDGSVSNSIWSEEQGTNPFDPTSSPSSQSSPQVLRSGEGSTNSYNGADYRYQPAGADQQPQVTNAWITEYETKKWMNNNASTALFYKNMPEGVDVGDGDTNAAQHHQAQGLALGPGLSEDQQPSSQASSYSVQDSNFQVALPPEPYREVDGIGDSGPDYHGVAPHQQAAGVTSEGELNSLEGFHALDTPEWDMLCVTFWERQRELQCFNTLWLDSSLDLMSCILAAQAQAPLSQDLDLVRHRWIQAFCQKINAMVDIIHGEITFTVLIDMLFQSLRPAPTNPLPSMPLGRIDHADGTQQVESMCPEEITTDYLRERAAAGCSEQGAKAGPWICLQCPDRPTATFSTKDAWLKHMRMHDPEKLWCCREHKFMAHRRERLRDHFMKKGHGLPLEEAESKADKSIVYHGEKNRVCPWCHATFRQWKDFYKHIEQVHMKDMEAASIRPPKRRREEEEDDDNDNNGSNGGGSTRSGNAGGFVNVPNHGRAASNGKGQQNYAGQNRGGHGYQARQLALRALSWLTWLSLWKKSKFGLNDKAMSDWTVAKKSWMTASRDKLWFLVDALDTGTEIRGFGTWTADSPECVDGDLNDKVISMGQDCELALAVDMEQPNAASHNSIKFVLRKSRTFPADVSPARCDACVELRDIRKTGLDQRFQIWTGEIHTIGHVTPDSWQPWGSQIKSDWKSRMDYSTAIHEADQEREEMSLICQSMPILTLSASSIDTIESNATVATEYGTDDDKAEVITLYTLPSVTEMHDIEVDADDDTVVESRDATMLSDIHELEAGV